VFLVLQACLGLSFRNPIPQLQFSSPILPAFLQEIRLTNLRVGDTAVDLVLQYHPQDVGVRAVRRVGNVGIVIVK
jgi:hypothetical protein